MVTKKEIQGKGDVKRNKLLCAVDISDTDTPEYVVIGYKVSSSTVEFNPNVEKTTDILGDNYSDVTKLEISQTFEPHRLTAGEHGKLAAKLITILRNNELEKLSQFKCILIYGFLSEAAPYEADLYKSCTISVTSLGGESYVDMPITIDFGGEVEHGTVDKGLGEVTFTATPQA